MEVCVLSGGGEGMGSMSASIYFNYTELIMLVVEVCML